MVSERSGQVAVIGIGNWGSSLATALAAVPGMLHARIHAPHSAARARRASMDTWANKQPRLDAPILWLCVPDVAIAKTADWIVGQRGDLYGQIVVHSSGALDRTVLARALQAGARTASVHPMMSFPTRLAVPLAGTRFAVEAADEVTRRALFTLVRRLEGKPFVIDSAGKAMYHAGAMFGSPLLVATLAAGVRCLRAAGLAEREALELLAPMAAATVANVQRQGLARSFSGPVARGDAATVKLHRRALAAHPLEHVSCCSEETESTRRGLSSKKGHKGDSVTLEGDRKHALVAQVYDSLVSLAIADLPSADRDAVCQAMDSTAKETLSRRRRKASRIAKET